VSAPREGGARRDVPADHRRGKTCAAIHPDQLQSELKGAPDLVPIQSTYFPDPGRNTFTWSFLPDRRRQGATRGPHPGVGPQTSVMVPSSENPTSTAADATIQPATTTRAQDHEPQGGLRLVPGRAPGRHGAAMATYISKDYSTRRRCTRRPRSGTRSGGPWRRHRARKAPVPTTSTSTGARSVLGLTQRRGLAGSTRPGSSWATSGPGFPGRASSWPTNPPSTEKGGFLEEWAAAGPDPRCRVTKSLTSQCPCFAWKNRACLACHPASTHPSFIIGPKQGPAPATKRRTPGPAGLGPASGKPTPFSPKTRDVNPMIPDPTTTKYMIKAQIKADGIIEKRTSWEPSSGRRGLLGTNSTCGTSRERPDRTHRVDIDAKKASPKAYLPALELGQVETGSGCRPRIHRPRSGPARPDQRQQIEECARATQAVIDRGKQLLSGIVDSAASDSELLTEEVRAAVQGPRLPVRPETAPAGPTWQVRRRHHRGGRNDGLEPPQARHQDASRGGTPTSRNRIQTQPRGRHDRVRDGDRAGNSSCGNSFRRARSTSCARTQTVRVEELPTSS